MSIVTSKGCPVCGVRPSLSRVAMLRAYEGLRCRQCKQLLKYSNGKRALVYITVFAVLVFALWALDSRELGLTALGWLIVGVVAFVLSLVLPAALIQPELAAMGDRTVQSPSDMVDAVLADVEVAQQRSQIAEAREWSCEKCGERNPEGFESCWNCEASK